MSSVDVGTAFVRVLPNTTTFAADLQRQVNAAVAQVRIPPLVAQVSTAGGIVGGGAAGAAAAANANLRGIEKSSTAAAKGMLSAKNESRLLQGSLIGLSRVTPVAVFGLGLVGTAAIAVGLAVKASISDAAALQQQINLFQAVSGATAGEIQAVSLAAKQLGSDLSLPATSAGDAASALTELAKAGLSVQNSLDAVRGVLQLSAAANISAGEAAKITATQLNAFGLAGEKATQITDLLAGASIAAQGEIGDFAAAFQQSASAAKTAGISVQTTTGLLTQLALAGIKGADAGTSLRTAILRLVPTTKEAKDTVASLGIEFDRNKTIGEQLPSLIEQYRTALLRLPPADKIEALNQIFGQDAFRAASVFFSQTQGALENVTAEVSRAGTGAELAEARMKGFAGSVEGLKSQAQTLGATLGTAVLPALTATVGVLQDVTSAAITAAKAIEPLSNVTIEPIVGVIGGADTAAQLAFAVAVGLGVKHLLARRAATKASALAAKVAATEIAASAVATSSVQVAAAQRAGAANVAAAGASARAWKLEATVASLAAAQSARNILSANKGLIAGLVASIAGSQLSNQGGGLGQAGSVLSGAGQGAIVGSLILPGVGTAVGAGAGAFLSQLSNAKKETVRNKASWDALDYEEQLQALRDLGPKAGAFLGTFGLQLKQNPFSAQAAATFSTFPTFDLSAVLPKFDVKTGQTSFIDQFGQALKRGTAKLPATINQLKVTRQLQLELKLAIGRATGSSSLVSSALKGLIAEDRKNIAAVEGKLNNFGANRLGIDIKERDKLTVEQTKLWETLAGHLREQEQAIVEAFSVSTDTTIAGIAAGATKTLTDNLAAQKRVLEETSTALNKAIQSGASPEVVDDLRVQQATADANISTTQQQISDERANAAKELLAKQQQVAADAANAAKELLARQQKAAADAANAREENLRFFADQAGNQGKAEKRLISFLKERLSAARGNVAAFSAAQSELRAEQANFSQAVVAAAKSDIDLRNARLATSLQAAELTPQISDNLKIFNLQLKELTQDQKNAERLAAAAKGNKAKQNALLLEVESLKQKVLGVRASIKNLKGESQGGFTLQQLFQEAADEFSQFGSNIAPRGGILSPQDARGAFSASVLAGKDATIGIQSRTLTQAEKQTQILQAIYERLGLSPTVGQASRAPETGSRGSFASIGEAMWRRRGFE